MVIYLFPLSASSELGGHDMPVMDMEDVLNKYVEDVMDYWEPRLLKSRHPPKFRCGCGRVASRCTIGERYQQRKCLCCQVCKMRIWEDVLNQYLDDLLFYCQASTIDSLKANIQKLNGLLMEKDVQISLMEKELMKLEALDPAPISVMDEDVIKPEARVWKAPLVCAGDCIDHEVSILGSSVVSLASRFVCAGDCIGHEVSVLGTIVVVGEYRQHFVSMDSNLVCGVPGKKLHWLYGPCCHHRNSSCNTGCRTQNDLKKKNSCVPQTIPNALDKTIYLVLHEAPGA